MPGSTLGRLWCSGVLCAWLKHNLTYVQKSHAMASNESDGKNKEIKNAEIESVHAELINFKDFELKRVISDNSQRKTICFEGAFNGKEGRALIVLEKKPFTRESLANILNSESRLHQEFFNDIYGHYEYYPQIELNGVKTTVIHPATEKHIAKFEFQPTHIVEETPDLYKSVTLAHLGREQFSLQWVFNILEHKSELERIVFEDPDPDVGFVLLPDLKWDGKQLEDLYLIAIVHPRGIKSLRDLTSEHLPLLKNLQTQGIAAIEEKYKLPGTQLRIYLHYQPSFYHLHVHYTYLKFDAPGIFTERAHLLSTVINNIELMPDYYQKACIPFVVKETDNFFREFEKTGVLKKCPTMTRGTNA